MPSRYLRRSSPDRLKPCSERMVDVCDVETADGCCGVIPCKLCLEWETYDDLAKGESNIGTSSWSGTVGGLAFVSYWERNYESGECEYIVTLEGEEVYRATCYEGASCRDPQGETAVSTAYLEGTLRWSKYDDRELPLIDDPDTGCRTHFCGNCRCSCDCLCVTLTKYGGEVETAELCSGSYECDPPVWSGVVGDYDVSIALGRDTYGDCIITLTADGNEQPPVAAPGCNAMTATVTMPNGDVFLIRCKQCACDDGVYACCGGVPLPRTLYADIISPPNGPAPVYECYNALNVPLEYREPNFPTFSHQWVGETVVIDGCGRSHEVIITLTCVGGSEVQDEFGNVRGDFTATIDHQLLDTIPNRCITNFPTVKATSCDPFMLGDDTWGDQGDSGLLDCIFGIPECIECPAGLSLRITE